ncbi:MAG: winged helix-turn-helix transcriptional regulator [Mycobacteriales bacterium]
MRSYGQYCSIARALDVVGDRWTLLIVRELLMRGSCRFTDLKNGLPGIAPNLLSSRLKELEQAALISREDAPPPIATTIYRLTPEGVALEPVLKALGGWGLRYMTVERDEDTVQAHWLGYATTWFTSDADPDAPPAVIQLVAAGEAAVIEIGGGQIHSRVGCAPHPDLTLAGPPRAILGLLTGMIDLDTATQLGLALHGRRDLLTRLRPLRQASAG